MKQTYVSQLTPKEKLRLAKNTFGLLARVARLCNVTRPSVTRVVHGRDKSERISKVLDAELEKEIKKSERLHARLQPKPKADEEQRVA